MNHLITFSSFIFESENTSAGANPCPYYQDKSGDPGYTNFWKEFEKMPPEERKSKMSEISDNVSKIFKEVKGEYQKWYSHPDTARKFTREEDGVRRKLISDYLPKINCKLHIKPDPKQPKWVQDSWGWFATDSPFVINVGLYNFFNGKQTGNKSIKDTIKHELAHAIDAYFSKNGVRAYDATHPSNLSQEEYAQIYLINDKDQFARLNILRGLINAGPTDTGKQLLEKFLDAVKKGKITSKIFDFEGGVDSKKNLFLLKMIPKKLDGVKGGVSLDAAKKVYSSMMNKGAIMVGNKENYNIEQLFSNFGKIQNNQILVDMSGIAKLNFTSKGL